MILNLRLKIWLTLSRSFEGKIRAGFFICVLVLGQTEDFDFRVFVNQQKSVRGDW